MLIQIVAMTCSYLSTDAIQVQCAERIVRCAKEPLQAAKGLDGFNECVYQEQLAALTQQIKDYNSQINKEQK